MGVRVVVSVNVGEGLHVTVWVIVGLAVTVFVMVDESVTVAVFDRVDVCVAVALCVPVLVSVTVLDCDGEAFTATVCTRLAARMIIIIDAIVNDLLIDGGRIARRLPQGKRRAQPLVDLPASRRQKRFEQI